MPVKKRNTPDMQLSGVFCFGTQKFQELSCRNYLIRS